MKSTGRIDPARRPPTDAAYAKIHWLCMGLLAALAIHGFVLSRFIHTPRSVGFGMVVFSLLAINLIWWSIADRRFARHIDSPRLSTALRVGAGLFSAALNLPILVMLALGRFPEFLNHGPTWYAAAIMLWQMGLLILMPIVAALRLAALGVIRVALALRGVAPADGGEGDRAGSVNDRTGSPNRCPSSDFDPTRRALLKTCFATLPVAALAGITIASRLQEARLQVNRHRLPAPWLPSRLRGLTITQISDLHLGKHYRPGRLPELIDKANALDSDIVVITGDIVDVSNEMLPAALDAFAQLTHRHGLFACIGNHDEIDDRDVFLHHCRDRLPMLLNERRLLHIGGENLTIAGLDWARGDTATPRGPGHEQLAAAALQGHDPRHDGPIIALAHHPHAWDALARRGVPLTLSGHTHGGQLMLSPPDERPDLGAGNLLFRYIRGFYRRDGRTLFVNRGVGNWFPLRINSPAEIVQLQLV